MKQALSIFNWVVYSNFFLLFLVSLFVAGRGTPSRAWDGHLSNTQKWIVRGDIHADKARDFIGKGHPVESSRVRKPRRTCLSHGLQFYGDGISFWVVLSQSFWLRVLPGGAGLFSQEGCQKGFWEMVGHVVSPFDLSPTLAGGGGLLVPCSLPGPAVLKQLMQMFTMVPGQGGWFQLVCFPWQFHFVCIDSCNLTS